jgi:hypothetical protein
MEEDMAVIPLHIREPANDKDYYGSPTVNFSGTATVKLPKDSKGVTLYYRWYSSIPPAVKQDHYAMNETAWTDPETPFSKTLGVGSHTITFAVSDREGQTLADMEAIQYGGVTGGAKGDNRCVIHVFKANMIEPVEEKILFINKEDNQFIAEAPLIWTNPDYKEVNRLRYRWEFIPSGEPKGRKTVDFTPDDQYKFEQYNELTVISYTGRLPEELVEGDYQLILHVEDKDGKLGGDQYTIQKCSVKKWEA